MTSVNMYVGGDMDEIITFPTPTLPSGFDMAPPPPFPSSACDANYNL